MELSVLQNFTLRSGFYPLRWFVSYIWLNFSLNSRSFIFCNILALISVFDFITWKPKTSIRLKVSVALEHSVYLCDQEDCVSVVTQKKKWDTVGPTGYRDSVILLQRLCRQALRRGADQAASTKPLSWWKICPPKFRILLAYPEGKQIY